MADITEQQGLLDLSILNAESQQQDFNEIVVELSNKKIPIEIITRLKPIWEKTKEIAGEIVNIGKIIVLKIINFIKENPNMSAGIALGAAIGAIIGMVPFFGPLLQPIVTALSTFLGIMVGGAMDRGEKTDLTLENAIKSAKVFLSLFVDIFISVKQYFEEGK